MTAQNVPDPSASGDLSQEEPPDEAQEALRAPPFLAGLGLVTGATLALEVLYTRLLSVLTWYSLAFFVIGMGLCGLTAGALRVYLSGRKLAPRQLASELSRVTLAFAALVPASYVTLLVLPLRIEPVATTVVLYVLFSAAVALPFYPAGAAIAAAVTRSPVPIGRVYAVDLLGAALGAPLVVLLLRLMDCGTAILLIGAVGGVAAWAFAAAARDGAGQRRAAWAVLALAALALANGSTTRGLRPLWVKERPTSYDETEAELWNSHSLIEVMRAGPRPAWLWGQGSKCTLPTVQTRVLVIDGHAATPLYHADGGLESLRFLECDVTDVANLLRPGGSAAVIGVGGSRDVQAALLSGHAPVLGIELNDRLLEVLRGPLGEPTLVAHRPDVRLVHDDARSYLSRSDERFRVIQASLIDTWAATGAGAHALAENGLYTVDAWRTFLARLEPGGVFTVSRWATAETGRMLALALATLQEAGATRPRDHIALLRAGWVTTLIVGRDPLGSRDAEALRRIADERGFSLLVIPGERSSDPSFEALLSPRTRAELERLTSAGELDLSPPTDDRPFFFNVLRPSSLLRPLPASAANPISGNLVATRALGMTTFASMFVVAASILVPLGRRARPRGRVSKGLWAACAYFSLIGVGFMLVEIALLQRLSIVLGHPVYGLVVVLSSLVGAAGLGALISDRLPLDRAPWRTVYPIALAGCVLVFALGWPALAPRIIASATPVRLAWAAACAALVGVPLGMAFPAGLRLAAAYRDEAPWLWGLNGAGSVLASSVAILIALSSGLTALALVGAACYALLLPAVIVMRGD